jgi:hypothetical protein
MKLSIKVSKHTVWVIWNKSCCCKASLDISSVKCLSMSCIILGEELKLINMVDSLMH